MRKIVRNARVLVRGNETRLCDIEVVDGRIRRVEDTGVIAAEGAQEVDFRGHLTLPGVIDGHVHFNDPGFTHREDFETGTRSAAAGGVTCVVDMPCTSKPPVVHAAAFQGKHSIVAEKAWVDYLFWGGVSGNVIQDVEWRDYIASLAREGVAALKVYLVSGMNTFRDLTIEEIRAVCVEAAKHGLPVGVHAELKSIVMEETANARGENSLLAYARSRPSSGEIKAVEAMIALARETGAKIHIVHLGSGEALDLIVAARAQGVPITAETCPHYLAFTREDFSRLGSVLKTAPVVKSEADRERLWRGVASGEIAFVTTDHAAGEWPREKQTGSAWSDYGGIPGTQTLLPYMYSEGYRAGRMTLERLVEVLCRAPATFFGARQRKGHLASGLDADFVVIDESDSWTVSGADLRGMNRYTPFEGQTFQGRVVGTWVRGARVYAASNEVIQDPVTVEAGWGELLRASR